MNQASTNYSSGCDNCGACARAILDNKRLCVGCLFSALVSCREPALFEKVIPLPRPGSSDAVATTPAASR